MPLFLTFVVALSITAALIPVLARWAPMIGLTDAPGPRKVHSEPVPRVGGLAMAVGMLVPILLTLHLSRALSGLVAGILILLPFGLWDDRKPLGYRTKFAGQILAVALCMIIGDVRLGAITIGGVEIFPAAVSTLLTFVFLIGITNAVNLADGLDGLAGGLVLLCLCAIALFAAAGGATLITAVALIEAGAILGFLRFNTHPARIFMGDSGSQVLGFSVGVLALLATRSSSSAVSPALPLLLLGLPIVDTVTVMWTRVRAGRSPFVADSGHLHHRLLHLGLTHREAVLAVYLMQVALVLLAYFLRYQTDSIVALTFCAFAALLLAVMATTLIVYAATVLVSSSRVGADVGVLSLVILVVLLLVTWRPAASVQWFERACVYISVVLLVYLDQTIPDKPPVMATVSWTLIGITGAAALLRFWFSTMRRFEVTTLDMLVIFIALVMPNLPGSIALPVDLVAGVAKAVILLYVVEMLLTINLRALIPRVALMTMLAVIAGRALIAAGS